MLTKQQKQKTIELLSERISRHKVLIFTDITGLKTKELFLLRKKLKEEGNEIKVSKKTLLRIALERHGIKVDLEKLTGQLGIVFGYKDEVLPAKTVWEFSKENKNIKILGGIIENKLLEADKMIEFAQLPSKEELLGKLVGSISSPLVNLLNVLEANIKGLILIFSQIKPKNV